MSTDKPLQSSINNQTTRDSINLSNLRLENVLDLRGFNDRLPDNYIQPSNNTSRNTGNQQMVSLNSILGLRDENNLSQNPNVYQGHINFHHSVHHDGHHILNHVDPEEHQMEQTRLRQQQVLNSGLPSLPALPLTMNLLMNGSAPSNNRTQPPIEESRNPPPIPTNVHSTNIQPSNSISMYNNVTAQPPQLEPLNNFNYSDNMHSQQNRNFAGYEQRSQQANFCTTPAAREGNQVDDYSQDVLQLVVEQQKRISQLEDEVQQAQDYINKLEEYVSCLESDKDKGSKKQSRYWTQEEHKLFLEAIEKFGKKDVKAIAKYVGTRNATQVRTHAQKYDAKIDREQKKHREKKLDEAKKRQSDKQGKKKKSKRKKRKMEDDEDMKQFVTTVTNNTPQGIADMSEKTSSGSSLPTNPQYEEYDETSSEDDVLPPEEAPSFENITHL